MQEDFLMQKFPSLQAQAAIWEQMFPNRTEVKMVRQGVYVPIYPNPPQFFQTPFRLDQAQSTVIENEITRLLAVGAIVQVATSTWSVNPFVVTQPNGKQRVCFDMSRLTEWLQVPSFKMETLVDARNQIRHGDWLAKIDLTDAYHSVPIHPESQHLLGFHWKNRQFQWKVLPFGLASAPWLFTRMIRCALSRLRAQGMNFVQYLDDILVINETQEMCAKNILEMIETLTMLGFLVNHKKSMLIPTQNIEFLGLALNTMSMTIRVPREKLRKLRRDAASLHEKAKTTPRELSRFLGLANSVVQAIRLSRLQCRWLQRELTATLAAKPEWDAPMKIGARGISELQWWTQWATFYNGAPLPLRQPPPNLIITTDASETGWGATLPHNTVWGQWTAAEAQNSSNWRELRAVMHAINRLAISHPDRRVLILTDNTTVVAVINKFGTTASTKLLDLAKRLHLTALKAKLSIRAAYLPGSENGAADEASRRAEKHDYGITEEAFQIIQQRAPTPLILDLFATATSTKCHRFWTRADDALSRFWPATGTYAFPPPKMVLPAVQHAIACQVRHLTLVTPAWNTWQALALLRKLSKSPPHYLPPSAIQIPDKDQPHRVHPCAQGVLVWTLMPRKLKTNSVSTD